MSLDTHTPVKPSLNQHEYISIPLKSLPPQAPLQSVSPIHTRACTAVNLLGAAIDQTETSSMGFTGVRLAWLSMFVRGISVVTWISSFLLLSILLYEYDYLGSVLSILLLVRAISSLGLLWIKWLWTFIYKSLCDMWFNFSNKYLGVDLLSCMLNI